jgi:TRAP-type mannitol/chloroaromatic compound transport system permease large subunit
LAIAFAVRLTGGVLGVTSGTVVGTVVVAIGISLKLLQLYYYNKGGLGVESKIPVPMS